MPLDVVKIESLISPVKARLNAKTARLVVKCASLRDAAEVMQSVGDNEGARHCHGQLREHLDHLHDLVEFSHRGLDGPPPYSYQEFFGD